ncbi:omega-3 fatty acid desaturase, chloroplastic-like [Hibiscus syriacus]|uniref:omega-3 fatty acid desaturase, chloroplastic-like n=1 Tax=Hibiscus syriacus TaxID=106335 RepID=UPI001924D549|nr:omega-3 fatty acid desaturase, chloroplastic-like [Hibiscus syriacus]
MASWILSECGLRPLPIIRFYSKPRPSIPSNTNNNGLKVRTVPGSSPFKVSTWCRKRSFVGSLNVIAPLEVVETINGVEDDDDDGGFDRAVPLLFNLTDIRAVIPKHCWVKDLWRSMSYVLRDVVVFGLSVVTSYFNNLLVCPLYWVAQGTMFWALFVLGHDCGHGSFSNNTSLNSVVGHPLHSSILILYHGWLRINHRTHHQNHGHVKTDDAWHPLSEKIYKSLDNATRLLRFTLHFPMLAYPIYLWSRSPGNSGSHFDQGSDLFDPNEKIDIITSTTCWAAMVGLLMYLSFAMGPTQLLKLYGIPYWIFFMWLDLVTYLHHHGHDEKFPWYRGKVWKLF